MNAQGTTNRGLPGSCEDTVVIAAERAIRTIPHASCRGRRLALMIVPMAALLLKGAEPVGTDGDATGDAPPANALALSVSAAVVTALEHNVLFRLERVNPEILRQAEQIEQAVFDPRFNAGVSHDHGSGIREADVSTAEVGLSQFFATGTTATLQGAGHVLSEDGAKGEAASWDVAVTQALLEGRRPAANLARLRQARIDTQISKYELRAVAEALVAAVERAYWDCVLAQEKIDIYVRSLEVAEQQISEVRQQVDIGKVAELELAAAAAEVAEKHEELIAARGDLAKRLLLFRKLLAPADDRGWWTQSLALLDRPEPIAVALDSVEAHVELGLARRPELAQAQLLLDRRELELVRTRDGILPRLDLFVRLGGTHYSRSFVEPADDRDQFEVSIGVVLDLPLPQRREHAADRIARLGLEQQELALANMKQLVILDVRTAYLDVDVAGEQIVATGATRKLRQDTLTAEQEKFRVGTSTTLQVAQAWRDLLASQINEIEARIQHRKALIDLFRLDSSLLERRGIDANW